MSSTITFWISSPVLVRRTEDEEEVRSRPFAGQGTDVDSDRAGKILESSRNLEPFSDVPEATGWADDT